MTASIVPDWVIREDVRNTSAYPVTPATGMVKLDAMENPYTLPESLRQALAARLATVDLNRYPDPTAPQLRQQLRQVMDIPERHGLLLGNGSDEIIQIAIQAVAREGATVMAIEPSFVMYRISARHARVNFVGVDLKPDFSLDEPATLAAMREHRPAIVFIAYPNNPSGNLYDAEAIARIIRAAPGLVVVDEAYQVFAGASFLQRLDEFPNLMVMRTVSKLGLAGIRLGYAAAHPDWIAEFDKVRPPYNVGVLNQAAGEVMLAHHTVLVEQAERILAERSRLYRWLAERPDVISFPSDANFILIRVKDAPGIYAAMKQRKVLIRTLHGSHPLLEQCLRLTVGTPQENDAMMQALEQALATTA